MAVYKKSFPKKKYKIIYADPPWRYTQKGNKTYNYGMAERHYSTMSLESVKKLSVPSISDKDCFLFLWATFPQIQEALQVIEAWDFVYKTVAFVWIKTTKNRKLFWGQGAYTRANSEVVLLAVKRGMQIRNKVKSHAVHSVVFSPHLVHSKKPAVIREKIEKLLGSNLSKIELFAREMATGWDSWGIEL